MTWQFLEEYGRANFGVQQPGSGRKRFGYGDIAEDEDSVMEDKYGEVLDSSTKMMMNVVMEVQRR